MRFQKFTYNINYCCNSNTVQDCQIQLVKLDRTYTMSILKLVDITTLYLLLSRKNRRVCWFCIVSNVALWSTVYFPQEIYKLITIVICKTIFKIHYNHSLCQESKSIFFITYKNTKYVSQKGNKTACRWDAYIHTSAISRSASVLVVTFGCWHQGYVTSRSQ